LKRYRFLIKQRENDGAEGYLRVYLLQKNIEIKTCT